MEDRKKTNRSPVISHKTIQYKRTQSLIIECIKINFKLKPCHDQFLMGDPVYQKYSKVLKCVSSKKRRISDCRSRQDGAIELFVHRFDGLARFLLLAKVSACQSCRNQLQVEDVFSSS